MKRVMVVMTCIAVFLVALLPSGVRAQGICYADCNGDLTVNLTDLVIMKTEYFRNDCEASGSVAELEARIAYLEALLANVTRGTVDGQDTIRFSGVNVQIVSGSGNTGEPINGRGNLIVGYNELRGTGDDRTGSHNIVVGSYQNYSSYGGLVAGYYNEISGPYASVSGGFNNIASYYHASVSGGAANTASGFLASVSGGLNNQAIGWYSFVGGGGSANPAWGNYAVADYSAILGGADNTAGDPNRVDTTIGQWSTVSGGRDNIASGDYASVSGGGGGSATGVDDWVAGGLWQDQ